MYRAQNILLFFLVSFSALSYGQYTPGVTYFGTNNYIEYHSGNLPIILSAPHGGSLKPPQIPDRNCSGCVYVKDNYTLQLTLEVAEALYNKTNCYPHVIINNLHRIKLDANRDLIEATDGDSNSFVYWYEFNNFIDSARVIVTNNFSKGLFFDMHGHGHSIQRLEIGYLLSKNNLQSSDSVLNDSIRINKSSLKSLSNSNLLSQSHAELVRGSFSLGSMLSNQGFPSVPSSATPFPLTSEPYFSGGFNTKKWGSRNGGNIDGIQIEHNSVIRNDSILRKVFADSLATTILAYLEKHYFVNYSTINCNPSSVNEMQKPQLIISPNPTHNSITILADVAINTIVVYNLTGKLLIEVSNTNKVNLASLVSGMYIIRVELDNNSKPIYKRIVKD